MPERDPANEPENLLVHWYGRELSENAKAGMREMAARFPNSNKELWVLPPRRPGETGQQEQQRLLAGYAEEARRHGYTVKHVRDETRTLARGLEPKYTSDTLDDVFRMESANDGYITTKDLAYYLASGTKTSLSVDLSHHHMRDSEWQAVQQSPDFSPQVVAPVDFSTAELKIVDLSHGQETNLRHVLSTDFLPMTERFDEADIQPEYTRHLDVFAMYAREGTRGQEFAKAAAGQYIGYLAQIAQNEALKGNVTFRQGDDHTRFRPETVKLVEDNLLGAKYNPGDPRRNDMIGMMNIAAATDAIHLVYGRPRTPDGQGKDSMPVPRVDPATWDAITMQAFDVNGVKVLPQIGLTKTFQGSWRRGERDDAMDLGPGLDGDKITLVQASNIGVAQAAGAGISGLDRPSRIPYDVQRSSSAGNSPRRTPSPQNTLDMEQLRSEVASMSMPRTPSPEQGDITAQAAAAATKPVMKRSTTGPAR
ncbi:hypothetical protein ACFV29_22240 [Streptomyces sp. NPDC059690]|uniref:hypothetical protein n=1 Tax=Streptomyces sp. NPDC059690 TaxID=3346907 RepID=UPI0036857D81